jgi:hypothetical protein
MNIGIPEILLAFVIGLSLWVVRRIRVSERAFPKYMLIVLAILAAVLIFNWARPFRVVN